MSLTFSIVLAVLLDQWLGEPKKHHPLIYFGQLANHLEKIIRKPHYSAARLKCHGLLAIISLIAPITALVYLCTQVYWLNILIAPVILYFCIAAKSLKQHACAVLQALDSNDLALAKKQLSLIVSRQTEKMTDDEIRKATIESVLENGADAIFAPVFWFMIAGPAGAILYRLSNTLDAMWGYKNQKYFYFGRAAARFDDILNWIPARMTAISYALLGHSSQAISCWKQQAHLLDSPNAGPVMTSGAGALNVQLGGPAWYHGKLKNKIFFGSQNKPGNNDIYRANRLINHTVFLWIFILFIVQILGTHLA